MNVNGFFQKFLNKGDDIVDKYLLLRKLPGFQISSKLDNIWYTKKLVYIKCKLLTKFIKLEDLTVKN